MQAAQGAASTSDQQSDTQSHRHLKEDVDQESLESAPTQGDQVAQNEPSSSLPEESGEAEAALAAHVEDITEDHNEGSRMPGPRPQSRAGWTNHHDPAETQCVAPADNIVRADGADTSQVNGMEGDMASEMDEADFVDMLNRVLHIVGLRAKVSRFDECAQASVFVAIFERLFQVRLSNVIRNPETYEDRVLNCQRVIDALGGVTNADIAADRICSGDFDAIASLITVFHDLCQPESSRSAPDVASGAGSEWWAHSSSGPFDGSNDSDDSPSQHTWANADLHKQAGLRTQSSMGGRVSTASSHSDEYRTEGLHKNTDALFQAQQNRQRRVASRRPSTGHLRPTGGDLELHDRIERQRKYDARRARELERVARLKHEKTERIAAKAAQRDRRHQKVWANQLARQLQQEVMSSEARREAQRENITKKLFMLALRQKRDTDVIAEKAERERRNERRRRDNERFQAWEQWYQDQCSMLDEEKAEEQARHETWERERQAQLREMERTVRGALVKQMQRICNEIRQKDERYEARLGFDSSLEPDIRTLGKPGTQWRKLVKRIANQLVDAAELNRVVRVA